MSQAKRNLTHATLPSFTQGKLIAAEQHQGWRQPARAGAMFYSVMKD